ncbi:dTDP-4-dehydrorhamnose reductase [Chitinophaga skermanii]|uniref:dTDP-4-dehydrorhamnose reductase n=1 Tax=Chitinophaga skermanii TaxID=331697 RepID=A0A327QKB8_9BACT|nr:SDR family oxidoreductase [Chitinophaga skermanii]RAJ05086.1 dTDP-4-dehydrorhamnose reductase [Chitinophaga skermanii]
MQILVTGSNGLLGQYLIHLLKKDPAHSVIAIGKGQNRLKDQAGYTYVQADITDNTAMATLMEQYKFNVIFHCAAMTQADDCERNRDMCWEANVTATADLVKLAEKYQSHFIFLSTDFVFDGLNGPYIETDLVNPVNYYGSSKVAAERVVAAAKTPWAIVRTVLVYGLSDDARRSNIITWVKDNLSKQQSIKVVTDQFRTPTLVHDLAIGCKLVMEHKAQGIFHISGEEGLTPFEMAQKVAKHYQLPEALLVPVNSATFTQVAKRPAKTGFIIDKAKKELGYQPRSFDEGIDVMHQSI